MEKDYIKSNEFYKGYNDARELRTDTLIGKSEEYVEGYRAYARYIRKVNADYRRGYEEAKIHQLVFLDNESEAFKDGYESYGRTLMLLGKAENNKM